MQASVIHLIEAYLYNFYAMCPNCIMWNTTNPLEAKDLAIHCYSTLSLKNLESDLIAIRSYC